LEKVIVAENNKFNIFIRKNIRNIVLLSLIIVFYIIFGIITPGFFQLESFMNIIRKSAVLFVVSIGMSLVILTGELDLSLGSNAAFSGAVGTIVALKTGNAFIAIMSALITAMAIGFINGLLIGKFKINSIVLTLAMLGITRSLTKVILNTTTLKIQNNVFNWLGSYNFIYKNAYIPVSFFFVILFYILFYFILNNAVFGRNIKALGGNSYAAKAAGVLVERNKMLVFIITGAFVGIAAILTVGRASAASPFANQGLEFEAATAVIIGGASLRGGKVDIIGTFLGVLLLGVIFGGIVILNIVVHYTEVIKGLLLLLTITINHLFERYQREY